jgi:hypothetical protein
MAPPPAGSRKGDAVLVLPRVPAGHAAILEQYESVRLGEDVPVCAAARRCVSDGRLLATGDELSSVR